MEQGTMQVTVDSIDHMADVLDRVDEMNLEKTVQGISKFAKAATAFSAASTGLGILSAILGGESAEEKLLKRTIKLLEDLKRQLTDLQKDVQSGFDRVIGKVTVLGANAQVFDRVSYVNTCYSAVSLYLKCLATGKRDISHHEEIIKNYEIDDLRTAVEDIKAACEGHSPIATNILAAVSRESHGDFQAVNDVGMHLLAAASCAAICEGTYWTIKHKGHSERLEEARRNVEEVYGAPLTAIANALNDKLRACATWANAAANCKPKLGDLVSGLEGNAALVPWPQGYADFRTALVTMQTAVAEHLQRRLTAAYPSCLAVVAVSPKLASPPPESGYFTASTFSQWNIPCETHECALSFRDERPARDFRITLFLVQPYDVRAALPPISDEAHETIVHYTNKRNLHLITEGRSLTFTGYTGRQFADSRPYCRVTCKTRIDGVLAPPVVSYPPHFFTHRTRTYHNPHEGYQDLESVVVYAREPVAAGLS